MGMLLNPTNEAARSVENIIPVSFKSKVNLINPAIAPIEKTDIKRRLGTLNKIAKPVAAIPDQIIFSIMLISMFILIKVFEFQKYT